MRMLLPLFLLLTGFIFPYSYAGENAYFIEVSHYPVTIPRTMTVSVTDHEGKPLPEAEIVLQGTDGGFFPTVPHTRLELKGRTNQDGKVVLHFPDEWFQGKVTSAWLDVKSQRYSFPQSRAWYDGRHPRPGTPIVIPEEVAIEFDGEMVEIRILDENGKPVEGVKTLLDWSVPLPSVSDAQGMLALGPLTGHQLDNSARSIRLLHPDFQNETIAVKRSDLVLPPEPVRLHRGSEIFGKVVDEQGNPIAGAGIYASGEKRLTERETVTDAEGRYQLKGLFPSDQILMASKDGMRLHVQTLNRDELGKEHDIALKRNAPTIRIKVVTEDGQPLHGVKVEPKYKLELGKFSYENTAENILIRGGETISNKTLFTDENGFWEWQNMPAAVGENEKVEFRLEPRRAVPPPPKGMAYRLSESISHFQPREEPYIVTASLQEDVWSFMTVNFTTWKDSKKLKVRVLDENRKPLVGALVEPCSGYGDSFGHFIRVDAPFSTDENGTVCFDFSRTDVSDIQDFWVKVSAEGYRPIEYFHTIGFVSTAHSRTSYKTLKDKEEIVLSPNGKLVGFVRDENGKPVEGATVTLDRPKTKPVQTDSSGKWTADISDRPLDTDLSTQIHVKKDGYLDSTLWLRSSPDVTLQSTTPVSIRIVDEKGEPLEGVEIVNMQSATFSPNSIKRQTDSNGEIGINFGPAKNNKVEFLLKKDGWTAQWHEVDLAGETKNLHFSLKPSTDFRVRFMHEGEKAIPHVREISAMIHIPSMENSFRYHVKRWNDISPDENGVFLLKDAPDCEAVYHFYVPNTDTPGSGAIGYGETITPNDNGEVIQVTKERHPENRPETRSDSDYGRATPYGLIHHRGL